MHLNQGQLSSGGNKLLPETTNLTSWLTKPTTDGRTLSNIMGTSATLTGINVLDFAGSPSNTNKIELASVPNQIVAEGIFEIEMDILIDDSTTGFQRILWFYETITSTNGGFFRIQKNQNENTYQIWARNNDKDTYFKKDGISFTPDTFFNLKITGDGTNVVAKHDGVTVATTSINQSNQDVLNYVETSIGDDGTSFDGKISNFKMTGGTTLHTHLPLQEGSEADVYDISGNGNHGTITGATWTTSDVLTSHNTLHGFYYDDGSDNNIPALTHKTKQVVTFDGVNDNAQAEDTGLGAGDFYYSVKFRYIHSANKYILTDGASGSGSSGKWSALQYTSTSGGLLFITDDNTTKVSNTIASGIPNNHLLEGYIQRIDGTISVSLNNLTNGATYTDSYSNTTDFFDSHVNRKLVFGALWNGSAASTNGEVEWHDFKAGTSSSNITRSYDFQSNVGATTIPDTTGSNNLSAFSITTSSFWKKRIADSSGSIVSGGYNFGYLNLTNPSGFVHNQSEVGFDLVSVDKTSANILDVDNSNEDDDFARDDSNGNVVQYLQYSSGISGTSLTRTRAYVG